MFLYREVLDQPMKDIDAVRSKTAQKLPVVLSREEIRHVMAFLNGINLADGSVIVRFRSQANGGSEASG